MIHSLLELSAGSLILLALGLCISYGVVSAVIDPLRDIPGPFLARFTRLWYFFEVYKGSFEISNVALHKTYGSIVRIAPNEYSIDDVEAAKSIYGHGNAFVKVCTCTFQCVSVTDRNSRLLGTGHGCHLLPPKLPSFPISILTVTPPSAGNMHRPTP
jgi:hypothetical protein